jgi:hypothetical protein
MKEKVRDVQASRTEQGRGEAPEKERGGRRRRRESARRTRGDRGIVFYARDRQLGIRDKAGRGRQGNISVTISGFVLVGYPIYK